MTYYVRNNGYSTTINFNFNKNQHIQPFYVTNSTSEWP